VRMEPIAADVRSWKWPYPTPGATAERHAEPEAA